mmetsp:Transcript_18928/g.58330  ORF Transcript_18928/g.58330 Transcript_18928/m.58330 type:complete len:400 (+) Transcript_18928:83-1282(+)|eukprot:CAMPEP_0198649318 /NCGR_PEP_ID=MMETSP1467-20131203/4171_1 /TAXON_ID=1462469 /ORGANISM="unid. sp., Strain CCMP2135" /LENGTH=399 /DNA_ID=CAMNT_0044385097 /DNA_START=71 /DNA_END=1270 /DNA_ORIENTATION=+
MDESLRTALEGMLEPSTAPRSPPSFERLKGIVSADHGEGASSSAGAAAAARTTEDGESDGDGKATELRPTPSFFRAFLDHRPPEEEECSPSKKRKREEEKSSSRQDDEQSPRAGSGKKETSGVRFGDVESNEEGPAVPRGVEAQAIQQEHRQHEVADGLNVDRPLAPVLASRCLEQTVQDEATRRVLVVDDSFAMRRFVQRVFESHGYHVDACQNGWQAFAQMQSKLYDFVFLDIEMPVMNGYRCAQALRKWEEQVGRKERQVICALTSHTLDHEMELGKDIGINFFEAKPARPKRLLDIVEQAVRMAGTDVPAAAALATLATAQSCGHLTKLKEDARDDDEEDDEPLPKKQRTSSSSPAKEEEAQVLPPTAAAAAEAAAKSSAAAYAQPSKADDGTFV